MKTVADFRALNDRLSDLCIGVVEQEPVFLSPVEGVLIDAALSAYAGASGKPDRKRAEVQLRLHAKLVSCSFLKAVVERRIGWILEEITSAQLEGARESLSQSLFERRKSIEMLDQAKEDLAQVRIEIAEWRTQSESDRNKFGSLFRQFERYREGAENCSPQNILEPQVYRTVFETLFDDLVSCPPEENNAKIGYLIKYLSAVQRGGMNAHSLWTLCKRAHKRVYAKISADGDRLEKKIQGLEALVETLGQQIGEIDKAVSAKEERIAVLSDHP
jgi:exonuclease VII small subunit